MPTTPVPTAPGTLAAGPVRCEIAAPSGLVFQMLAAVIRLVRRELGQRVRV